MSFLLFLRMIKKLLTSIFLFSLSLYSFAQSNSLQVISSAGSTFTNENYIIEYTLGELAIESIGNGIKLTQGFHQGELVIQTGIHELDFIINLYPNPTQTHFKIEFDSPQTVNTFLSDITGNIIFREQIVNQLSKNYDVSYLAQGVYTFTIIDSNNKQTTYKIKKLR